MPKQLEQRLLNLLSAENYRPLNKSELSRELDVSSKERSELRGLLAELIKRGQITRLQKGRFALRRNSGNRLVGSIRIHKGGRASFTTDLTDPENLKSGLDLQKLGRLRLSGREMGNALNGDRVEVKIKIGSPPWKRGKPGGKDDDFVQALVTRIIERGRARIVGTYQSDGKHSHVLPMDPDASPVVQIPERPKMDVISGQLVSVELIQWDRTDQPATGRVIQVLGWPGDPGVDIEAIIQKHGLSVDFSDPVLDEARAYKDEIAPEERKRRIDWTDRPVITIDPATAKDHDDAVFVRKLDKGGWELAVHIADVSAYVKPGTALDEEAQARGNSTYLVDRVLPMLPPDLSNDLCSLRPGVERLTKCALIEFSEDGRPTRSRFYDCVILSPVKFSYEEAQTVLEGPKSPKDPIHQMILESWELASVLRQRRFARGSLDLDFPEVSVILNDKGHAVGIKKTEHNESHKLIEEFMLAANESVARAIKGRGKPTVYRVHEDPDFDKLKEFGELASHHGYKAGDMSNKAHLQALLEAIKGSIEAPSIKLGLLKSLKRAAYSPDPLGHYGLGKTDYTHFTSPIRRYADLIVHRSLQPLLENPPKPTDKTPSYAELSSITNHISTTERASGDAENESKKLKLFEYLSDQPHEERREHFQATVTDIRPMGVFIELVDLSLRALVSRDELPDKERWFFDNGLSRFANSKGETIVLGQALTVEVIRVNSQKEELDCRVVKLGPKPKVVPSQGRSRHQSGSRPKKGHQEAKGKAAQPSKGKNHKKKPSRRRKKPGGKRKRR